MDGVRLRSAGVTAWSLVGFLVLGAAATLVLIVLRPLVVALLAALCIGVALSPLTEAMAGRGVRRAIAALLGTLALVVVAAAVGFLVVRGLVQQWDEISHELDNAVAQLQQTLGSSAPAAAQQSLTEYAPTLLSGLMPALGNLIGTVASLSIGVFLVLFTTYYLLKDGPAMITSAGRRIPLGAGWLRDVAKTLRQYVVGLTLLGAFNAVVVGLGALVLDVPRVLTIMIVTLIGNYIPYLGAWIAGAFTVLLALASGGVSTALIMIVIVVIANGSLQTLLQPFAFGAALDLSPLVILLVTIAGGLIAGLVGVTFAAPFAAIVQHTLRQVRQGDDAQQRGPSPAA